METMERYLELTEHGRILREEPASPEVCRTLEALHEYASERGGLELEGAWRLDPAVARSLTESAGYTPPGGWRAVAALAAGTRVLEAGRDRFGVRSQDTPLGDGDSTTATRLLLEAFTRRLVPPTTAAGLFILLGLHPAWGVHVAHRAHLRFGRAGGIEPSGRDRTDRSELFPDEIFEVVDDAVFDAIGVLVALFRKLEPEEAYRVDALSSFVDAVCRRIRTRARGQMTEVPDGALAPFVSLDRRSSNWRVIDFTTADLIDAFLVPAGAAHRFNDGTFRVYPGVFEGVRAGASETARQHELLAEILTDGPNFRVA